MVDLPYQIVATVQQGGRVQIPKWLRDDFDVEQGDRLVMTVREVERA